MPVEIKLKLHNGRLEVKFISDIGLHYNHPVSASVAAFYPENRRLTTTESTTATDLLASRVAPRIVAATLNATRRANGADGIVTPKDIFNKATAMKKEKRGIRRKDGTILPLRSCCHGRNGFGQPAALGFLSNEKADTLRLLFAKFKDVKDARYKVEAIFVDHDYGIV